MPRQAITRIAVALVAALGAIWVAAAAGQEPPAPETAHQETAMPQTATGTFEIELTPQAPDEGDDSGVGRMRLDKTFHGDLEGTSLGQMLAFRSPVEGSAGYVAIERVEGTLHGRRGSFVLQHRGVMAHGEQELRITVVPDSAGGELAGLAGSMDIEIADGRHSYRFEYTLGES